MAKTKLKIAERSDIFLYMTRVENLFINEFLPDAPGDYVKVYLFAIMYAQYDEEIDSAILAKTLGLEEFEVEEAWDYWEARGLVRRSKDGSAIEFIRMVERFYGKNRMYTQAQSVSTQERETDDINDNFDDEEVDPFYDFDSNEDNSEDSYEEAISEKIRYEDRAEISDTHGHKSSGAAADRLKINEKLPEIFGKFQDVSGRTISRRETEKLTDAMVIYEVDPEVLMYAIDYCADIGNYSADYVFKVAIRWKEDGCEDTESVEALLEKHSERNKAYRDIFKAVGFSRLTTPADREIMDRWFDEMGFGLDEVLEACKATGGIREPSLRYVNKILENIVLEKGGVSSGTTNSSGGAKDSNGGGAKVSRKVLREYYQHIRDEEEAAYADRIREASVKVPGIKELLDRENELNAKVAGLTASGSVEQREAMRAERKNIAETKRGLLASEGYPTDYLNRKYRCDICKDSGYTDEGTVCSCCRARADEAYIWNLERNRD